MVSLGWFECGRALCTGPVRPVTVSFGNINKRTESKRIERRFGRFKFGHFKLKSIGEGRLECLHDAQVNAQDTDMVFGALSWPAGGGEPI